MYFSKFITIFGPKELDRHPFDICYSYHQCLDVLQCYSTIRLITCNVKHWFIDLPSRWNIVCPRLFLSSVIDWLIDWLIDFETVLKLEKVPSFSTENSFPLNLLRVNCWHDATIPGSFSDYSLPLSAFHTLTIQPSQSENKH